MVRRYFELKPHLVHFENSPELIDNFLSPRKHAELENIQEKINLLDSVTKALQGKTVDLSDTRALFDQVIKAFPETARPYLACDANIVLNPTFEIAISELQNGQEHLLTEDEKETVSQFVSPISEDIFVPQLATLQPILSERRYYLQWPHRSMETASLCYRLPTWSKDFSALPGILLAIFGTA